MSIKKVPPSYGVSFYPDPDRRHTGPNIVPRQCLMLSPTITAVTVCCSLLAAY